MGSGASTAGTSPALPLVLLIAIASLTSCGFKSDGLADDSPLCGDDCGSDSAVDVPLPEADAPQDETVPPGTTLEGDFVGAAVSGSAGGIELTGSIHWFAAVNGTSAGITLQGTLQ